MPGFGDTTFIVLLALLLFGPKKLPVLARQLGKLMADFRRASNEFKIQMEEELRISEQAERQKQIAAIEAAAPRPTEPIPEPEHPHLPPPLADATYPADPAEPPTSSHVDLMAGNEHLSTPELPPAPASDPAPTPPLPIATSGDLSLMPPSTGLPLSRGTSTLAPPLAASAPTSATAEPERQATPELQTVPEHPAEEHEARPWMI